MHSRSDRLHSEATASPVTPSIITESDVQVKKSLTFLANQLWREIGPSACVRRIRRWHRSKARDM